MPIPSPAPYDSLETVTSLTRTILADYIQNLNPNYVGTVSTNGTALLWLSGNQFTAWLNGVKIVINGVPYQIVMVTSPTTAILLSTAGIQAGVPYSAVVPSGEIFNNSQAYVLPTVNLAWRKLQKKLADKGHPRLEDEVDLFSLPVVANLDPISQCWINWTNFFDGKNLWSPATLVGCPVLPSNFIAPLRLWERQSAPTGVINYSLLRPMHPAPNALRAQQKGSWNRYWDWREDAIYFPGSILSMDLRTRFNAYLPDITIAAGGFSSTPVPLMRCAEALAYYSAGIFVTARGSLLGPGFDQAGDMATDQITNAFAKLQQRASYSRRAWGSRGRRHQGLRN